MKVLILLVLTVALVSGQGLITRSGFNKDYPGKCYFKDSWVTADKINEFEKVMDYDEIYKPIGMCIKVICRPDTMLDLKYCQRFTQPESCEVIPQDLTKEFPQCCEKLKCKEGDKVVIRDITTELIQT